MKNDSTSPVVSPELERRARELVEAAWHKVNKRIISFDSFEKALKPIILSALSNPEPLGKKSAAACPKCGYKSCLDLSASSLQQPVIALSDGPEPLGITSAREENFHCMPDSANAETLIPSTNVVNTETGLASCPFCGSRPITWPNTGTGDDPTLGMIYAECRRCDIWLPLNLWNRRVPSPESTGESQPAAGVIPKSESLEPRGEPQLVDGEQQP